MTEAEKKETLARIEVAEEELAELKAKVQSDDEVPDEYDDIDKPLEISDYEFIYCVSGRGTIERVIGGALGATSANKHHLLFKSEKYAEMYMKKTQFIADLLHFKWLYGRDFEPDWNNENENKYYVWYDNEENIYMINCTRTADMATVYFSKGEIAKKCMDWLNRKAGCK